MFMAQAHPPASRRIASILHRDPPRLLPTNPVLKSDILQPPLLSFDTRTINNSLDAIFLHSHAHSHIHTLTHSHTRSLFRFLVCISFPSLKQSPLCHRNGGCPSTHRRLQRSLAQLAFYSPTLLYSTPGYYYYYSTPLILAINPSHLAPLSFSVTTIIALCCVERNSHARFHRASVCCHQTLASSTTKFTPKEVYKWFAVLLAIPMLLTAMLCCSCLT